MNAISLLPPFPPSPALTSLSPTKPTTLSPLLASNLSRRAAITLLASSLAAPPLVVPPLSAAQPQANADSQLDEQLVVQLFQVPPSTPSLSHTSQYPTLRLGRACCYRRRRRRWSSSRTSSCKPEEATMTPRLKAPARDSFGTSTATLNIVFVLMHQVTNYHVLAKLAMDTSGLQRCEVFIEDLNGNSFSREGKLIGFDPAYDLAVLKVDVEGDKLKPAQIGTSQDLRVGQSCFAIGNPFGYEHTLTTGVVSGLGREIPSPNGRPIRGAIQTDAAINAGNSGGPLIDSYGHVIGVNTATFTRKGSGISSGVNFAIPIDVVVRTVPYLIVYGTSVSNRF